MASTPAGYEWLRQTYGLPIPQHNRISMIGTTHGVQRQAMGSDGAQVFTYTPQYAPADDPVSHLEFSLKYDGIHSGCMFALFQRPEMAGLITEAVKETPSGKYARQMWFWYELMTGQSLELPDTLQGRYVDALDSEIYYVADPVNSPRHRVRNNITGTGSLIYLVRRDCNHTFLTDEALLDGMNKALEEYDPETLARAARYLVSYETKSSNEIESEQISPSKFTRFMQALEEAGRAPLNKERLIYIQNLVKEPHYQEKDYRYEQNYLGRIRRRVPGGVEFLPPKFEDAHVLMEVFMEIIDRIRLSDMPGIVKAAVLASGFVYIHPFMDGNGRVSRYIIQDTLVASGLVRDGIVLPISGGILNQQERYYATLNQISQQIMQYVEFHIDDNGAPVVDNNTGYLYRYMDMTEQAAYLSEIAQLVIDKLMPEEIDILAFLDELHDSLAGTMDWSNKDTNLVVDLLHDNNGTISQRKRDGVLRHIQKEELDRAEELYGNLLNS